MDISHVIKEKICAQLQVADFRIENESHMHSGPATNSHFKLLVVSDDFAGKRLVQRHQMIYSLLADEMQNPIHALALHLYTQDEWQEKAGAITPSPVCLGGSKTEPRSAD